MSILNLRNSIFAVVLAMIAAITSADAKKAMPVPDGMVLIPAGLFLMGNNNDFYDNDFDERPRHVVNLAPFYMDVHPVTNQDYKAFVEATGHRYPRYWSDAGDIPAGKEQHPVVGVNYFDATAFATWRRRRLPTEQEWEKASRGTEGLRWPWGNQFDKRKANVGQRTTTPIGAYPEGCNAYGLCGMSGNVWEWTTTWYAPYPDAPRNRAILRFLNDTHLSIRGGAYAADIGSARGADRGTKKPEESGPTLGIRLAMDVPGFEHYREALQTIESAREVAETAVLDISDYEEHTSSRELMVEAAADLSKAEAAFEQQRFVDSGILAQRSMSKAGKAQQLALDVTRAYQENKRAGTEEILGRLEKALKNTAEKTDSAQQELLRQVENHLRSGRQFEAEGGWGFAQMHGFIGMAVLQRLNR